MFSDDEVVQHSVEEALVCLLEREEARQAEKQHLEREVAEAQQRVAQANEERRRAG